MAEEALRIIARIRTDFPEKFGIPRQSGRVAGLLAAIVFEPEFRDLNALRGLEQYSHLWLIWQFSANLKAGWSSTVRPPRLGGNQRLGVFATRSPFRPNPLGLSVVKLLGMEMSREEGPLLRVSGADLMDGTPIFDIKPYLQSDCVPDARDGFSSAHSQDYLPVEIPPQWLEKVPTDKQEALLGILREDPRPAYQEEGRRYGFFFAGLEIFFVVEQGVLRVVEIKNA